AAIFTILTRLKESKKVDVVKKMRLYDGENVEGFSQVDVSNLRNEFQDEGMDGIDPRYVINRISSAIIQKEVPSINALDVLRSLKRSEEHTSELQSRIDLVCRLLLEKKKT